MLLSFELIGSLLVLQFACIVPLHYAAGNFLVLTTIALDDVRLIIEHAAILATALRTGLTAIHVRRL
jgi:hypothetical protein